MKRLLCALLAAAMLLSLAACGGEEPAAEEPAETPETAEPAEPAAPAEPAEPAEPEPPAAEALGRFETLQGGDLGLVVLDAGFQYTGSENNDLEPNEDEDDAAGATEMHCTVIYAVQNLGKTEAELTVPAGVLTYGDGYEFEPDKTVTLNSGGWGPMFGELAPLSDPVLFKTFYTVPLEAAEDEAAPLAVTFDVAGTEATYPIHSPEPEEETLSDTAAAARDRYDTVWLVRRLGLAAESAAENLMFIYQYAGNVNTAGEMDFSEDITGPLLAAFDDVRAQVDDARLAELLPGAAELLPQIEAADQAVVDRLDELGAADDAALVPPVQDAVRTAVSLLDQLVESDELLQFGRFASI